MNHKIYHRQCGMTQLCYSHILSKFVIYLVFYLVLSFLLHYLLLFKSKDDTFMVKKYFHYYNFLCTYLQKAVHFSQSKRSQIC